MIIVVILIVAMACSLVAYRKRRNAGLWFAAGILFSVIALVIIACLPPAEPAAATSRSCPDCGETVLRTARICRFCRHGFPEEPDAPAAVTPTLWQKLFWNPHGGR